MLSARVLVPRLNIATTFGCFFAGVLIIPILHDAHSGHLVDWFRGDHGSSRVSFIGACRAFLRSACKQFSRNVGFKMYAIQRCWMLHYFMALRKINTHDGPYNISHDFLSSGM